MLGCQMAVTSFVPHTCDKHTPFRGGLASGLRSGHDSASTIVCCPLVRRSPLFRGGCQMGQLSAAMPQLRGVCVAQRQAAQRRICRRSLPVASAAAVVEERTAEQQQAFSGFGEAGLAGTTPELLELQQATQNLKSIMMDLQCYTGFDGQDGFLSPDDQARLDLARLEIGSQDNENDGLLTADTSSDFSRPAADPSEPHAAASTSASSRPKRTRRSGTRTSAQPAVAAAATQVAPPEAFLEDDLPTARTIALPKAPSLPENELAAEDEVVASQAAAAVIDLTGRSRKATAGSNVAGISGRTRAVGGRRKSAWGKVKAEPEPQGHEITAVGALSSTRTRVMSDSGPADSMKMFMKRAATYGLLNADQEKLLAADIQQMMHLKELAAELDMELGREATPEEMAERVALPLEEYRRQVSVGAASRQQMIDCNQRLVVSIAKKYIFRGLPMEDLVAEGVTGLAKAAERFDPTRGFKFSTYAHWWIRQAVSRSVNEQARVIRLPVHLHDLIMRIRRTEREMAAELKRTPTSEEIAEEVGITKDRLHLLNKAAKLPSSTSAPISANDDSDGSTLEDTIADTSEDLPDDLAIKHMLAADVENALHTLTPRECGVLRMRYGLDDGIEKTLEDIGARFQVTRERIRQIESKAMRKMKQPTRQSMLKDYAGEAVVPLTDRKTNSSRRSG